MRLSSQRRVGYLSLWLLIIVVRPVSGFAGAVEMPLQPPAQELRAPPLGVQAAPPINLQVPAPLDLKFEVLDLQSRVEDVKGTAQALSMQETKTEVRIELSGDVLFDFDKADIRAEAEPALQQVVEVIRQFPKAKVSIDGHTDAKGADAYNLKLSERRAAAVKSWLVQKAGLDGKRITTRGWGKAKPVAPNTHPDGSDNPQGRQQNRRVEITVKK